LTDGGVPAADLAALFGVTLDLMALGNDGVSYCDQIKETATILVELPTMVLFPKWRNPKLRMALS
jgi:hypothetical protein